MVFPSALPVPSMTKMPVPIELIHVVTYFFVKLSYPVTPMLVNGCPIISPVHSCWRKRPSRSTFSSQVPVDSIGGLLGSIHSLVLVVQLPARLASCLWGSPGMASFLYVSIIACISICSGCFSFAIETETLRTTQSPINVKCVIRIVPSLDLLLFIRLL